MILFCKNSMASVMLFFALFGSFTGTNPTELWQMWIPCRRLPLDLSGASMINRPDRRMEGIGGSSSFLYSLNELFPIFNLPFLYFSFRLQGQNINLQRCLFILMIPAHNGKPFIASVRWPIKQSSLMGILEAMQLDVFMSAFFILPEINGFSRKCLLFLRFRKVMRQYFDGAAMENSWTAGESLLLY